MRHKDVEVEGVYQGTVSGKRVKLLVLYPVQVAGREEFHCTNLSTGRTVIKSAATLHAIPNPKPAKRSS
jgi:hypothetical protein